MGDIGEQRAHYDVLPARGVDVEPVAEPVLDRIPDADADADALTDPPGER